MDDNTNNPDDSLQAPPQREVSYELDGSDYLVRTVTRADGRPYAQGAYRDTYLRVAQALDRAAPEGDGLTVEMLVILLNTPFSQTYVALEFLKDRGCAIVRNRRSYPASTFVYEDALIEWAALAERQRET